MFRIATGTFSFLIVFSQGAALLTLDWWNLRTTTVAALGAVKFCMNMQLTCPFYNDNKNKDNNGSW